MFWATRMLIPYRAPTSLAEVTPDMRARLQLSTAFRVKTSRLSPRRRSIGSIPPLPVKCSWQSIIPGMRVRPEASMSSWCARARGRAASSPIQLKTPLSTWTLARDTGPAPVQSMSLTLRMTRSISHPLNLPCVWRHTTTVPRGSQGCSNGGRVP